MLSFTKGFAANTKRASSQIAIAIALVSCAALGVTALETPAYAAKKKKEKKRKVEYSKAFIKNYQQVEEMTREEEKDDAAIVAALPGLVAMIKTSDDRFAAGNLIYATGHSTKSRALQRQGVGLMLESGNVDQEKVGSYYLLAGQLAYQDKDWAVARNLIQAAIDNGYTDNDPETIIAGTYAGQKDPVGGLAYLDKIVKQRIAADQPVPEAWLKRGVAIGYENRLAAETGSFASNLVKYHPNATNWGDAIAIQRNLGSFDNNEILDLLRLADRTNSMRSDRDYLEYVEVADARRLPGEVDRIVTAGIAAGYLDAGGVTVAEARSMARAVIKSDLADLPAFERDARKPSSTAKTAAAAGDAFFSYGKSAQAEELYLIALAKDGVDTQRVLNRLGMAQIDLGKFADGKATLAKVEGPRKSIADLWSIYADEKAAAAAAAAAAEAVEAPETAPAA